MVVSYPHYHGGVGSTQRLFLGESQDRGTVFVPIDQLVGVTAFKPQEVFVRIELGIPKLRAWCTVTRLGLNPDFPRVRLPTPSPRPATPAVQLERMRSGVASRKPNVPGASQLKFGGGESSSGRIQLRALSSEAEYLAYIEGVEISKFSARTSLGDKLQ